MMHILRLIFWLIKGNQSKRKKLLSLKAYIEEGLPDSNVYISIWLYEQILVKLQLQLRTSSSQGLGKLEFNFIKKVKSFKNSCK